MTGAAVSTIEEEEKLTPTNKTNNVVVATKTRPPPPGLERRGIIKQFLMGSLANLTFLMAGWGFSYPAIALDTLTNTTDPMALTHEQFSWFASIGTMTIPIGCLGCGYILDIYGRKKSLYICNTLFIIAWIINITASTTDREAMFIQILVARALMGIPIGLGVSQTAVYGSEIAQKQMRGRIVAMSALNVGLGMCLLFVLGYLTDGDWRLVGGIGCGLNALALILAFIIPETPTWLASKGRIQSAEKSLRTFKGLPKKSSFINSELRIDLNFLRQQSNSRRNCNSESFLSKLKKPEVYKPFCIMLGFFTFVHLSGIIVMIVYAVQFSKSSGVVIDPLVCSAIIGVTRVVGTIVVSFTMDLWGRRILAISSGFMMSISMFGISAYVAFANGYPNWLPLVLIIVFVFSATLGLLSLPLTMNAEIYPQAIRGHAAGITTSYGYILSFFMIKLYRTMSYSWGDANVFLFYAFVAMFSVVYNYIFLPETKNKSLQEIEDMFKKTARNPDVI